MKSTNENNSYIWAKFRYNIISELLNNNFQRGELKNKILKISKNKWKHPVTGKEIVFGYSTIERWYYRAKATIMNPDSSINCQLACKTRSDKGQFLSLSGIEKNLLKWQLEQHPYWKIQKHYSYFCKNIKLNSGGEIASYSTIRRYLIHIGLYQNQHPSIEDFEKSQDLNQKLRKLLIVKSVYIHMLSNNSYYDRKKPVARFTRLNAKQKEFIILMLKKYRLLGGSLDEFSNSINKGSSTIERWEKNYREFGITGLFDKKRFIKSKITSNKKAKKVMEIFHHTPRDYGINRSSWNRDSLALAYKRTYRESISNTTIGRYIKKNGYSFRRSKQVLTSYDPDYNEKVAIILDILHKLKPTELFFFIDEMGPIRVIKHGGRTYTKNKTRKKIPQIQNNTKGKVTLYGALSATTNQITWFYGQSKDTSAMIDLIEILFNKHFDKEKLYITWDAASWHGSHALIDWLDDINCVTRKSGLGPIIELAPLPSCAQFLDVIESVFSGMKKAVIHNSNYGSEIEMKTAISQHFIDRNMFFELNPKRAGKKIWEIDFFKNFINIKSGNYREW